MELIAQGNKYAMLVETVDSKPELVVLPDNLNPQEFRALVGAGYAQWLLEGKVTLEGLVGRSGLDEPLVRNLSATPEFHRVLTLRGVRLDGFKGLTAKQDLLLLILGDPFDGLTTQGKLKKAGVSNATYQGWLKQPVFASAATAIAEQLAASNNEALVQLARKAGEGDLNAIKYLFEVNGRYNPQDRQAVNVLAVLQAVLESLSRHVKDPAALSAVANDMRQIAMQHGLAEGTTPNGNH